MSKILKVKDLSKKYNTVKGEIEAIKNVSFDVDYGEIVAIVGCSGCGKSTLLSILSNLESKTSGEVIYNKDVVIGYMLQNDALFEHLTILDNVLLGLKIQRKYNKESKEYVIDLLKKYDLYDFINKHPSELSGGMRQRVALIRTLALKPDILFLDEPFSALDYSTRLNVSNDVYKIIKGLNKTTIVVTHDINEAISMADRVIVLSKCPACIINIYNILLDGNDILERKNDVNFNIYYNSIVKDLSNV